MNNDIMSKMINKGIPIVTDMPILLRYMDLFDIIDEKVKFDDELDSKINLILDKILPDRSGFRFMRSFEIVTNPETLEREIVLSPMAFLNSLIMNLNVDDVCNKLTSTLSYESKFLSDKKFYDRLKVLKKIKTEEEFKKEFPYLYALYDRNISFYRQYLEFKKNVLNNPNVRPVDKIRIKAALWKELTKDPNATHFDLEKVIPLVTSPLYPLYDIDPKSMDSIINSGKIDRIFNTLDEESSKFKLNRYISNSYNTICSLIQNKSLIMNYLLSIPIDFSFLTQRESDKLELYITYMFLRAAEIAPFFDDKQKLLYYISNYFFENRQLINSNLEITVEKLPEPDTNTFNVENKNGVTITPKILYERYKKLLIDNPDLRVVDSSKFDFSNMTIEEVNSYMETYLKDLSATWDFLPPDDVEVFPPGPGPGPGGKKPLTEEELEALNKRIIDLYMEKKEFYGSTNPMFRVRGKKTFDGYIGYIYPNGKVVLDKFFDNVEKGIIAYGSAVYIMNLDDFYELSRYSKSELMRDKMCERFVHVGDWKERVTREINSGKANTRDDVKKKLLKNNIAVDDSNN